MERDEKGGASASPVTIRFAQEADIPDAAIVVYEAFGRLHDKFLGGRVDFTSPQVAEYSLRRILNTPGRVLIVAEFEGKVVGTNGIDMRDEVAGIGPVAVHPDYQGKGIARLVVEAILEIGKEKGMKSIRLMQEAFNTTSYSLYAKCGFHPKDHFALLVGAPTKPWFDEESISSSETFEVRKMTEQDIASCDALHKRVAGITRLGQTKETLSPGWIGVFGAPYVAADKNTGEILGFATAASGIVSHGVSVSEKVAAAIHYQMCRNSVQQAPYILKVFGRLNPNLLRWGLSSGLVLRELVTNMVYGEFSYPIEGCVYIPSISY